MIRTKPNLGGIMSPRTILTTLILTLALGGKVLDINEKQASLCRNQRDIAC